MSITCEQCLAILDTPEEMVGEEAAMLMRAHLEACPSCSRAAERLEQRLRAFRTAPPPEPPPAALQRLLARVEADRAENAPIETARAGALRLGADVESASSPRAASRHGLRPWTLSRIFTPFFGSAKWWAPAIAAICLVVWLGVPAGGLRPKGGESSFDLLDVDLQAVLVRSNDASGGTEILPVFEGTHVLPGDGLIFRFVIEGGVHLMLIERDPNHDFRVIYQWTNLGTEQGVSRELEIADQDGGVLRYVPDGPPGEYTYIAVLAPVVLSTEAGQLDAIWGRYVETELSPLAEPAHSDFAIDSIRIRYLPDGRPERDDRDGGGMRGEYETP